MLAELILVEKMKVSQPSAELLPAFQRAVSSGVLEEVGGEFRTTFNGRKLLLSAKWILELCRLHKEKGVPVGFLDKHHLPALAVMREEGAILGTEDRFYGRSFIERFDRAQVVENF